MSLYNHRRGDPGKYAQTWLMTPLWKAARDAAHAQGLTLGGYLHDAVKEKLERET